MSVLVGRPVAGFEMSLGTGPVPRVLLHRPTFDPPVPVGHRVRITGDVLPDRTGRLHAWRAVYSADGVAREHHAVVVLDDPGGSRRAIEVAADHIEVIPDEVPS
jgi:hypothetical protein